MDSIVEKRSAVIREGHVERRRKTRCLRTAVSREVGVKVGGLCPNL